MNHSSLTEFASCLVVLSAALLPAIAPRKVAAQVMPTTSPREQLKQYVADLQKHSSDDALREKIIALAGSLQPLPAMTEEARKHFVKAETLFKEAHDVPSAIEEYQQGLVFAPWWGDAYHDLGFAQETAGRFDEAKKSLHFYLLTKPPDKDARGTQDEIYKIEAKQQEAEKRAADEAAKAQAVARARAITFAHKWYYSDGANFAFEVVGSSGAYSCRFESTDSKLIPFKNGGGPGTGIRVTIRSCSDSGNQFYLRETVDISYPGGAQVSNIVDDYTLTLSDDGMRLIGSKTENDRGSTHSEQVSFDRRD